MCEVQAWIALMHANTARSGTKIDGVSSPDCPRAFRLVSQHLVVGFEGHVALLCRFYIFIPLFLPLTSNANFV